MTCLEITLIAFQFARAVTREDVVPQHLHLGADEPALVTGELLFRTRSLGSVLLVLLSLVLVHGGHGLQLSPAMVAADGVDGPLVVPEIQRGPEV